MVPPVRTFAEVASFIRQNEVGRRASLETPFGRRLLCYADLTATGRYLHFVEAWVRRVRPFYANTHTAVSTTGRLTGELREEARKVIRRAVNAGPDDVVLFVGSGATAAINKLVGLLGIKVSEPLDQAYGIRAGIPEAQRPIVFVGPYEHHSNELPWLESVADLVEVGLNAQGGVDVEDLKKKLRMFEARPLKIGAFSAASNVTGVLTDVRAIARILHQNGAYAVFDYAAAGPYVPIDMHPADPQESSDALFLSTHKFIGGPEGSGILVASRALFRTKTPERPGGGTVDFVAGFDKQSVDYAQRLEEREEGGTPAIVGDLRAGIGFLVKQMLGPERVLEHETRLARMALERLGRHPRIKLLGPMTLPRLAILSFNVEGVHHDLVSVLLDHLFGIQNRAGCSCAGPYGHLLLGIDRARSELYRRQISRGLLGIKPGWVRVSIPYYSSDEDVEFLLSAVEFVADHAKTFVTAYRLCWQDGVWRHIERLIPDVPPLELSVEALEEAAQSFSAGDHEAPLTEAQLRVERARYFEEARAAVAVLKARMEEHPPRWNPPSGDPELDSLVWFDFVTADRPQPQARARDC
jgi:selenocysteine lyase/cysteine desulfurase